jgi:hypothetical protein
MTTAAAIVIGFTPFHLLPMRELMSLAEGELHVFHPMAGEPGVFEAKHGVVFLGKCDSPVRSRWAKYFRARRDIDEIMGRGQHVNLYLPHPFNPLANHAFFHAGTCSRFVYQDGILNYYDAAVPLASLASRLHQRAKGLAVGSWFQTYGGHLSGVDALPMTGGFFTHPDRIVAAEKFPLLRRLDFHGEVNSAQAGPGRGTLFLDQPIESVVGLPRARELRRRTVEYVNGLGGKVCYKPHYAQHRETSFDPKWTWLAPELSKLPAEWVVDRMSVANVVSFCTSALANIAMSHESISCHATAANLIPVSVDRRPTTLAEVLSGLGVKIVELQQN